MIDAQTSKIPTAESSLVSLCLAGDRDAWVLLIDRYRRLIYSVARHTVRDPGVADDVFQEVCLELYRHLDEVRDPQALPKWLITVTRRLSFRALDRCLSETGAQVDLRIAESAPPDFERRFWIEQALGQLCGRCRALVEMLYFDPDQPSYQDVADRLGMPVSSVGPTRARCLQKLRRAYEGER